MQGGCVLKKGIPCLGVLVTERCHCICHVCSSVTVATICPHRMVTSFDQTSQVNPGMFKPSKLEFSLKDSLPVTHPCLDLQNTLWNFLAQLFQKPVSIIFQAPETCSLVYNGGRFGIKKKSPHICSEHQIWFLATLSCIGNEMQPLTLDTFNYKLIFLLCKFSPHSSYA